MRADVCVLISQKFFNAGGYDYSSAIAWQDISLWPSYQATCERVSAIIDEYKQREYTQLPDNIKDENSPYVINVRLNRPDGHAVVLKAFWKTVDYPLPIF